MAAKTDKKYITSFLESDQAGIRDAYKTMKWPFIAFVRSSCTQLDDIYLEDVYHESFLRMQQNILLGKLTTDNLSGSLLCYLEKSASMWPWRWCGSIRR